MSKKKPPHVPPTLTPSQLKVATLPGPLLAGATAGAGKSTSLIERVAHLVHEGARLDRILLVAFNVIAAADLNTKLKKRFNMRSTPEVACTLHSLAYHIFKSTEEGQSFIVDSSGGQWTKAIRFAERALELPEDDIEPVRRLATKAKNDYLLIDHNAYRENGVISAELMGAAEAIVGKRKRCVISAEEAIDAFYGAEAFRLQGFSETEPKFVGFDDMLWYAAHILDTDDEWRRRWQQKYDHVIVDEAQDLCEAQWVVVERLAEQHRNIVVTGDPSQALYEFRSAKPQRLISFPNRWHGCHAVYMEENFRSGTAIVDAANRSLDIMDARTRLPMHLRATRLGSGSIEHLVRTTSRGEAAAIAETCEKKNAEGRPWKEMTILVRMNDQGRDIELEFFRRRVPLRMVSGQSFFSLKEAKAMLAYLRVMAGRASKDDLYTCITNPSRRLGKAFVEAVAEVDASDGDWLPRIQASSVWNGRQHQQAREFVEKMSEWRSSMRRGATPGQLVARIIEQTGFGKWAAKEEREGDEPTNESSANLKRTLEFMYFFETVDVALTTVDEIRQAQADAGRSRNAVTLITVHKAKGSESPVIFVAGLTDKRWPIPWGDLEEEKRIFYVAVTRARDELYLCRYTVDDDGEELGESSFLKLAPPVEGPAPTTVETAAPMAKREQLVLL